jgi:hypothetical protein
MLGGFMACPGVGEASVPYGSEVRNRNQGKEASVEGYVVDGLAASGEPAGPAAERGLAELEAAGNAVAPGLGPLVVQVAVMYAGAAGAVLLEDMERLAVEESRKIGLGALQLALDVQADAEVPLPGLRGTDGHWRGCREKSATTVVTMLGPVRVRRIAYRSRKKGVAGLHWRDAVLNLPPCGYSWQMQKFAEMACRSGSFREAGEMVHAATGNRTGNRQLEEITARAAADAGAFAQDRPVPDAPVITGPDGEERAAVLGMSADAKGVTMRPQALRPVTARRAAKRDKKAGKRLGSGEKPANKRMAETGAVFDSLPPHGPARTPEDIMLRPPGQQPRTPQAANKWYTCGITATCADVIALVMEEADRRDPGRERDWLALVDGNAHQIECFKKEAAARGKDITILIDCIHVIEYLWKAALCFTPPGDTAATEKQATAWGLDILAGNSRDVITDIQAKAAADPPVPGSEHDKNIRRATSYLTAKEPYLDYPTALASGWPIATGIIEGACRHLIGDRMGIAGARWSLPGAQAMLWMRAIAASGDLGTYWHWHITREHQRNHLSKFQNPPAPRHDLQLAA